MDLLILSVIWASHEGKFFGHRIIIGEKKSSVHPEEAGHMGKLELVRNKGCIIPLKYQ